MRDRGSAPARRQYCMCPRAAVLLMQGANLRWVQLSRTGNFMWLLACAIAAACAWLGTRARRGEPGGGRGADAA
jgi:hypothetical protein